MQLDARLSIAAFTARQFTPIDIGGSPSRGGAGGVGDPGPYPFDRLMHVLGYLVSAAGSIAIMRVVRNAGGVGLTCAVLNYGKGTSLKDLSLLEGSRSTGSPRMISIASMPI